MGRHVVDANAREEDPLAGIQQRGRRASAGVRLIALKAGGGQGLLKSLAEVVGLRLGQAVFDKVQATHNEL